MPTEMQSAEHEIHQLVARYSDAVNRRNADAWRATWTHDAEWELQGSSTVGREAIVARWLELMEQLPFVLQLPSFGALDSASELTASGRWYVNELIERGDVLSLAVGVYHDRYRHEEGDWRFARRSFEVLHRERPQLGGTLLRFPASV